MVRHADVLHHLVVLEEVHVGERILLRVDGARLERAVDAAAVDGDRFGAERADHVVEHLAVGHPHLEAGEVGRHRGPDASGPAIWRIPLSNAPTGKPTIPFAAISSRRYAPSGPSTVLCACSAERNANGTCWMLAAGTTLPRMPPISVKNCTSPETSSFSTAGSLPGILVVLGEDLRLDASARFLADRGPHFQQPLVQRTVGHLVVVLREPELPARSGRALRIVNDPTVAAVRKDRRLSSRPAASSVPRPSSSRSSCAPRGQRDTLP